MTGKANHGRGYGNMRRVIISGFISLMLLGCQTIPSLDGSSVLGAAEVKRLFVGNTVESYNLNTGFNSFTYYHPSGQAIQERLWARRKGSWSISDDGKICLAFNKATPKCRHIMLSGGRHYKVLQDESGKQEKIVLYRYFAPGNSLAES